MKRTVLIYGLGLAAAAVALQWLEYQYLLRIVPPDVYVALLAVGFTALGVWAGVRLTRRDPPPFFERNDRALEALGLSEREYDVLRLVADGHSNKEIAKDLFISPNTVKTHLAHVYAKLDVSRRTQAVEKARRLRLIP